ncbi:hypothetical protein [Nitrospira moscoviensis]|uniref:Uncharacterized protein n=1 Tax=Nitrospira moscoviensis TaxID=42253 RepID=A0A0K2G7Q4_NITMO|nr:hypothetical protein [Nitrospira moscoviensis]ALA56955.1 hypothetical protein NITMOv2_0519 [Nitrospira moscoviensis]
MTGPTSSALDTSTLHSVLQVFRHRKTRRFGCGMEIPGGPLRYRSELPPIPLSKEEIHYLLFAGIGQTGMHLGDMQYAPRPNGEDGQGMAIMSFQGRTVPSPCAAQATRLFMTDDTGLYFVARVPDPESGEQPVLIKMRDGRLVIPREMPYMLSFNQWYANQPGSLYLIPVTDVASVYLNLLLVLFSEECGYFVVDTDRGSAPCGLDTFRRSRGGHLHDDPGRRRTMTLRDLDGAISDTALQEQAVACQNMFLMEQAIGLGGGIHSVGSGRHLLGWEPQIFEGLGFHFEPSSIAGVRSNPVGVARVWEGPCPPFTLSVEDAVRSLMTSKFDEGGPYSSSGARPWIDAVNREPIRRHSEQAVEATIAFCNYIMKEYGRFPAHADAFKTVIAFQAHHIDPAFYDRFYPQPSLPLIHRVHMDHWHMHESAADRGEDSERSGR